MPLKSDAAARKDRLTAQGGVLMEHRHMAFIAATIKNMPAHAASLRTSKRSVALAFADALAQSNPRFDRVRFMTACGEE